MSTSGDALRANSVEDSAGPPQVFMSYAWDDDAHVDWVLNLATRLMAEGIDVALDRWDTPLGSDLALFMEQAADLGRRVLAVVSDQYVDKSDAPQGGVGFERKVIAPTVMKDLAGDRIVPVLRQNLDTRLPKYMGSAKYIDFRDDAAFEDRLYELVHELHGHPVVSKPPIGPNPFAAGLTEAQVRADIRHDPSRYVSAGDTGVVTFDHSNNNGCYTLGSGDRAFTLDTADRSHGSIYVHNDPPNIRTVALAPEVSSFAAVGDATQYDGSSRSRAVGVGDTVVLQNQAGFWAVVLIDQVLTRESSTGGRLSLTFRYAILPGQAYDFTNTKPLEPVDL